MVIAKASRTGYCKRLKISTRADGSNLITVDLHNGQTNYETPCLYLNRLRSKLEYPETVYQI